MAIHKNYRTAALYGFLSLLMIKYITSPSFEKNIFTFVRD